MPAENLWRVDIVNAVSYETDENGKKAIWHSINSQVWNSCYMFQKIIKTKYVCFIKAGTQLQFF